jgi:hypothetical protein
LLRYFLPNLSGFGARFAIGLGLFCQPGDSGKDGLKRGLSDWFCHLTKGIELSESMIWGG